VPHGELTAEMAWFHRETKKKNQFEEAWQTAIHRDRQTDKVGRFKSGWFKSV